MADKKDNNKPLFTQQQGSPGELPDMGYSDNDSHHSGSSLCKQLKQPQGDQSIRIRADGAEWRRKKGHPHQKPGAR